MGAFPAVPQAMNDALDPSSPIGVFDSGVGGLTVVRALMERLPFECIHYFGDTARVPYGIKSVPTICQYAGEITRFLLEKRVKLLIIACNTMAAVAAHVVRDLSPTPVLDVIEAGALAAAIASRSKRIGVIGTPTTVNSNAYARAIHAVEPSARGHLDDREHPGADLLTCGRTGKDVDINPCVNTASSPPPTSTTPSGH